MILVGYKTGAKKYLLVYNPAPRDELFGENCLGPFVNRFLIFAGAGLWTLLGLALSRADEGTKASRMTAVPKAPVTVAERETLRANLVQKTVFLHRKWPDPPGFTTPGGRFLNAQGWLLASGRVLTCAEWVRDWPSDPRDVLELSRNAERLQQKEFWTASMLWRDVHLGLAMLHADGISALNTAPLPQKIPMYAGMRLYAVDALSHLQEVTLEGRGDGVYAWFWRAHGSLLMGTPLFDAEGRLVSLVALVDDGLWILPEETWELWAQEREKGRL